MVRLQREIYSKNATIGRLMIDDVFFCFTLEDTCRAWGIKVGQHTAIPTGKYKVKITYSNKFRRELPIIYTEPNGYEIDHAGVNFKGVRFHGGNTAEDTWGCPLVGFQTDNLNKIWETAETALTAKLKSMEDIILTVVNLKYNG